MKNMNKRKNTFFILFIAIFFLSMFFVGINNVKAICDAEIKASFTCQKIKGAGQCESEFNAEELCTDKYRCEKNGLTYDEDSGSCIDPNPNAECKYGKDQFGNCQTHHGNSPNVPGKTCAEAYGEGWTQNRGGVASGCNPPLSYDNYAPEAGDPTVTTRTYTPSPTTDYPILSSYSAGSCGNDSNFTKIGGVCFPANTGLADPSGGIAVILSNVLSWLLGIFTAIAIIAFVISGIMYLTSAGDTNQVEKAKNNAKFALLGVIVGLSGFIVLKAIQLALSGSKIF